MKPLRKIVGRDRSREHSSRDDWFSAIEGIVAEVDPATLAVRVVIPSIDEHEVHGEWVEALVPWVGPDGYGPSAAPAVGSEVVLFSRGNEGASLFYLCRFNEEVRPPQEFADGSRGVKTDTAYRLLADLLIQIRSAQGVEVQGPAVRLLTDGEMFRAEGDDLGFRGAAIARRALPAPGPTDTPLTVAIRQLLIELRLAQ